jgi:hypothetical protein
MWQSEEECGRAQATVAERREVSQSEEDCGVAMGAVAGRRGLRPGEGAVAGRWGLWQGDGAVAKRGYLTSSRMDFQSDLAVR